VSDRPGKGRVLQARAQRTRESLLAAAAEVFDRLGYSAATVDDIAQEAEVTKGGLAYHFPSKAEIAQAIVQEHHLAWHRLMAEAERWDVDGLEAIGRLITRVGGSFATSAVARAGLRLGNEYRQIDSELPAPFVEWIAKIAELLRQGQLDGSVGSTVNCPEAAYMIVGSFFGIQEISARLSDRRDLDQRLQRWWAQFRVTLEAEASARPKPRRIAR
jgi:AcrR family transcriptional regulator